MLTGNPLAHAADLIAEIASLREENARLREDCAATAAAWAEAYDAAGRMFAWMRAHANGWVRPLLIRHDWLPNAAASCRTALDAPPPPQDLQARLDLLAQVAGHLAGVLRDPELREMFGREGSPSLVRRLSELLGLLRSWLQEAAGGGSARYTCKQIQYWGDEEP